MVNKIGRNDACPCGSGKKHKKCCAAPSAEATIVDLAWRRLRQTEGSVVDRHLMPYVMKTLPPTILKSAIEDILPEEGLPDEIDEEHFFNQFVMPLFLFHWIPEEFSTSDHLNPEQTVAINYLNKHLKKLNTNERRFIEGMNEAYYSFYSIIEVEFEKSLLIKDILLGTTHTIKERQGTHYLKRGDIVFSQILTLEEQSIFVGMAPLVIPTKCQTMIIDFREWLIEGNEGKPITVESLRSEYDLAVLDYFFETIDYLYNQRPTFQNTDGDLILFSKTHFKLTLSIEESISRLLPLTLNDSLEEIVSTAQWNKAGEMRSVELPWVIKGNKKHAHWESTLMGHIRIQENKLILETNSEKRTSMGKVLLAQYLGDNISFQQTLLETPEQMASAPRKTESPENTLHELPEVQEQLQRLAKQHWESWFDSPIPALNNQTPREAAQSKSGQERLEALLLHYEQSDNKQNEAMHYFKADIDYLKTELKLQ